MMAVKVVESPSKYVQGPNAIKELGKYTKELGEKALVVVDRKVMSLLERRIREAADGVEFLFEFFNGECSKEEIERLKKIGIENGCSVIVGIGGGKTLDTAKAVAYFMSAPVLTVPTTASSNAPVNALSVIYTPDGKFEEYLYLPKNPDVVLVDSRIIAEAPVRFLVAGMGDALAAKFEAEAAYRGTAENIAGGFSTVTTLSLSQVCFETLLENGYEAKLAVEANAVTPAVEKVIEANILLSGKTGGLAAAHSIHNGLTELEETQGLYHGEKVAFSVIAQMVMEDRALEEIQEVIAFCDSLGLPVTLEQLGLKDAERDKLMVVAEAACAEKETIYNMPFPVNPEMVLDSMLGADALGREFLFS
ncbi:MAG: Iron-containing alcohol dehydrogenase [Clostridia bacterium 41_269]|nr:MAG: Iron-containing alcohol dehydrogenase [Clostridia bacterium 41_269]